MYVYSLPPLHMHTHTYTGMTVGILLVMEGLSAFLQCPASALGGVPEQVLRWKRIQIHSIQLLNYPQGRG